MLSAQAQTLWNQLVAREPQRAGATVTQSKWGDSPEMADRLGALIASGQKTATCSTLEEWEAEGAKPPRPGDFCVVLGGDGRALAIIETLELKLQRFCDVDAAFAHDEGEGDRSLLSWRDSHRAYFTRNLAKLGTLFHDDHTLVCERFRVVHVPTLT